MRIQIISISKLTKISEKNIVCSSLDSPESLDEFDINIIDLRGNSIWRNKENNNSKVNIQNDIENLSRMIMNRNKSEIVIAFPRDQTFEYNWSWSSKTFLANQKLKNMLKIISKKIISCIVEGSKYEIEYEPTSTHVDEKVLRADFYFISDMPVITKSNKSEKTTTTRIEDIYITSLDFLESYDTLSTYLLEIGLIKNHSDEPEWIADICFYNDDELMQVKDKKLNEISKIKESIQEIEDELYENKKIKSILYTNSDELVKVVFEILEYIVEVDLSEFKDEKKEDFVIIKENTIFIGEIKGISSNLKSDNVSQVDRHAQEYLEKNPDTSKDIKQLLIINRLKHKHPSEREPIHEIQIKLAHRNGALIITTEILLKLYEMFKNGEISSSNIIERFYNEEGLFVI